MIYFWHRRPLSEQKGQIGNQDKHITCVHVCVYVCTWTYVTPVAVEPFAAKEMLRRHAPESKEKRGLWGNPHWQQGVSCFIAAVPLVKLSGTIPLHVVQEKGISDCNSQTKREQKIKVTVLSSNKRRTSTCLITYHYAKSVKQNSTT